MKVLFIGNSHTYVHYVPVRTAAFCAQMGRPIEIAMLTYPGVGLDWHLRQHQTFGNLLYGSYDGVVLQHNAHPFPGRESLLAAGAALAEIIPKEMKMYLYMTWSEKKNPEGQAAMSAAYKDLARKIGAAVCPVGEIWQAAVNAHPEEEFYRSDGEHSSLLGASLAASVIGRTLLGLEVETGLCYADAKGLEKLALDRRMPDV
ncbi:MAG: hypothetical protein HFE45_04000 [Oscillospiraceae bacterium]|jgi:hypothetical protein|nr:hypothetical protein [Oscillospiraceae bacterium]